MKNLIRTCAAGLFFAVAACAAAANLTVVNMTPWGSGYVQIFYVGGSKPVWEGYLQYYGGVSLSGLANKPVFVRAWSTAFGRWDQSPGYTWINPNAQGILRVYPGYDHLGNIVETNMRRS